jgi:hypothetical protein
MKKIVLPFRIAHLQLPEDIRKLDEKRRQEMIRTKEVEARLRAGKMNHRIARMVPMEGDPPIVMAPQVTPDELHEQKQSIINLSEWDSIDSDEAFLDWRDQDDWDNV